MEDLRLEGLKEQYKEDKRFKRYVDRFAARDRLPLEDVLRQAVVREAAGYYREEKEGNIVRSTYVPMGECV